MSFLYLILASLFAGFGLGYIKFFVLTFLSHQTYTPGDKVWIIQIVGSLITIGPALIYFLSGPMAASFKKRWIMCLAAVAMSGAVFLAAVSNWLTSPWSYVFIIGLLMGIFNAARNAAVPLESASSGRSTEVVNGALNISFMFGLMLGVPIGTKLYFVNPSLGLALLTVVYLAAAAFSFFCHFPPEVANLKSFTKARKRIWHDSRYLYGKYPLYFSVVPLVWGLASALSLAVTAYAESSRLGDAVACSLLSVYAAVGVGSGNCLGALFRRRRYTACSVCNFGLLCFIILIPLTINLLQPSPIIEENGGIYWLISGIILIMGVLFGIVINLLESNCFNLVYLEKKEGSGAALMSASIAFSCFVCGGFVGLSIYYGLLSSISQFGFLAFLAGGATSIVYLLGLKKRENLRHGKKDTCFVC